MSESTGKTQGIRLRMRPPKKAERIAVQAERARAAWPPPPAGAAAGAEALFGGGGTAPGASLIVVSTAQPPFAGPPSPTRTPSSLSAGALENFSVAASQRLVDSGAAAASEAVRGDSERRRMPARSGRKSSDAAAAALFGTSMRIRSPSIVAEAIDAPSTRSGTARSASLIAAASGVSPPETRTGSFTVASADSGTHMSRQTRYSA